MAEINSKIDISNSLEQDAAAEAQVEYSWPPQTSNDVVDFFLKREDLELFHGFSRNALVAKKSIEEIIQAIQEDETIHALKAEGITELPEKEARERIYLPLEAGTDGRQVYQSEMTEAHFELFDSLYSLTHAELKFSEIDDANTTGRVWWQGSYIDEQSGKRYPMNFIEIHDEDLNGQYVKWQVVAHVPEGLVPAKPVTTELHPTEAKLMFRQGMDEIEQFLSDDFRQAA